MATVIEIQAKIKYGNLKRLANAMGYKLPAVHQVVAGYRKSWPKIRQRLSEELGIPESELFDSEGWPKEVDAAWNIVRGAKQDEQQ